MIWWPTETPTLYYGDITLRPAQNRDILPIFQSCQDPVIPQFTMVPSPYLFSDADNFIRTIAPKSFEDKSELLLVIAKGHGEDEKFCGLISFHTTNLIHHSTELGYWLAKEARGQGIGSIAARLLTDYGFTTMGFRRIEALVDPTNAASRALLTKIGFSLEGILRKVVTRRDGAQTDMAMYAKIESS